MNFKPIDEASKAPETLISDFCKMDDTNTIHVAFQVTIINYFIIDFHPQTFIILLAMNYKRQATNSKNNTIDYQRRGINKTPKSSLESPTK